MTAKTKLTHLQAYRRAREPASPISFIHPLTGLVYTVLTMAQVEVLRAVKRKKKGARTKLHTTLAFRRSRHLNAFKQTQERDETARVNYEAQCTRGSRST